MTDLFPVLNNFVVQAAGFLVALGVVYRYVVLPLYRAAKELEKVRALVASQHRIVTEQLTTNGGSSALDKINRLAKQHSDLLKEITDLKGGQHDLATLLAEAMALGERKTAYYLKQLQEHGIELVDLPDLPDSSLFRRTKGSD